METPFRVPVRRAAIGAPQEIMEEDMLFLRKAMEIDLPLVFQQRNPKQTQTSSRQRYEGYKKARTLREAKTLKASWADLVWDYGRGWIDFSSAASSNAVLNELIMDDYLRTVNDSAAAYVNQDGHPSTADKFSSLCFEESVQQDYAMIGMEVIEALSHRARRILTFGSRRTNTHGVCPLLRVEDHHPHATDGRRGHGVGAQDGLGKGHARRDRHVEQIPLFRRGAQS